MYDIEKDIENVAKAYDEKVDELGDQAMLRYCHEVPMRAALNASTAVTLLKEAEERINELMKYKRAWMELQNRQESPKHTRFKEGVIAAITPPKQKG